MVSLFVLMMNILGLLFLGITRSDDVSMAMSVPRMVNAGEEFNVEITLKKSGIDGFARFQQELPVGLSAQEVVSPNASFEFEDQKVRFIWLNLPDDEEIKLSYRVRVNERLKGNFELQGLFSYIEDNERRNANLRASTISITPSSQIDPNLIVDISEFQQMIPVQPPVSMLASTVRSVRQVPFLMGEGNDMQVNILVNKGATEKFAKIEEIIPQGYTAEPIKAQDGIFTYKDRVAKFLWMNLPPEPHYVVSYRLIPTDGVGTTSLDIKGTFSFIINGATQVIDIIQREIDLSAPDPRAIESLLASLPRSVSTSPVARTEPATSTFTQSDGGRSIPIQHQEIKDRPRARHRPIELDNAYKLEPEEGVYYRVQIAAGHRLVDIKRYFKRFNITEDIRTESHQGWFKYSIGSFYTYKDARDHRVKIWNTTPIDDAFVAAYNNGVRITVQEALMITNQQWYR